MLVFKQWLYSPNKRTTSIVLSNMMNYIATRDGVELSDEINLLKDDKRFSIYAENEMNYIATREGVSAGENVEHGLFGKMLGMKEQGDIEDLSEAKEHIKQIAKTKTTVYNAVISFDGETATKKDYTDREAFEALIQSNITDIAREMGVKPRTLEYAAAVHMESGHPHVHLMYWDTEQEVVVDFINPQKSNDIRKELTKKVFHDELDEIMLRKDKAHKSLIQKISDTDKGILKNPSNAFYGMTLSDVRNMATGETPKEIILDRRGAKAKVEELFVKINQNAALLQKEYKKGAFKYKYLPENIKQSIDDTSKTILSAPQIAEEYNIFLKTVREQAMVYGGEDNVAEYVEKAKKDIYKDIGNKVIDTIKCGTFLDWNIEAAKKEFDDACPNVNDISEKIDANVKMQSDDSQNANVRIKDELADRINSFLSDFAVLSYEISWSPEYKEAKKLIYDDEPDINQGFDLLLSEAQKGNALAMYDIAVLYEKGLGVEIDINIADRWYGKALTAFLETSNTATKIPDYIQYRIGKMYTDGLGTGIDLTLAEKSYKKAFDGFISMEETSKDDTIQYRIGQMYSNGIGTEKSLSHAVEYLKRSAEHGNNFAQYRLAKLYLDNSDSYPDKLSEAINLLLISADKGNNEYSQYALGKLYLSGENIDRDVSKALAYLEKAEAQGNEYAQYTLGKLYFEGTAIQIDMVKALGYFSRSAEQDNQFAQYTLGKLCLEGNLVKKNVPKALEYFIASAEQGNQYAQCQLGIIFLEGKYVKRNTSLAYKYLYASAGQGNEYAKHVVSSGVMKASCMYLLQSVLNLVANRAHQQQRKPPTDKNKLKYMSAIEKSKMLKRENSDENFAEWGEL